MADTAARMLALLGLLQARADWSGAELAHRLRVTDRTVRNDIDRLRGLGYPVDAVRGPGGRYRLGVGTKLPPLLLEEDEAVAVAVGLRAGTGIAGHRGDQRPGAGQARARAPPPAPAPGQRAARCRERRPGEHRLERRRPDRRPGAAHRGGGRGPRPRGAAVRLPGPDEASRLQLEPYRLVSWQRRWFVVARDARDRHLGAVPAGLDAPAHARRPPVHPAAAARRGLHVVRAARGRVLGLGRARPDRGRRPGRGGAGPDQPDRRRGRERGRRPLRAGHRRRQRRDHRGLHRHARPRLPRHRAAGLVEAVARVGDRYRRAVTATSGTPAPGP